MSEQIDSPSTDARLGRVLLDKYRLDKLLGEGGMGAVYRGEQLSVSRPVAIKLIAGKVAENPECVRRFRREAEAMARLRHPSTVRLYDFGVADEGKDKSELFMVMELLEGLDLSQHLLLRGRLAPHEALVITRQVLEALSEAHALGIVHRDLKPANIFLSQVHGGKTLAKVMDFGIAGIEQSASGKTKLTMTGAVMGTPAYMSPEQAQGKLVDARSDLYSLGIVLFEMLAGKPPFEAESAVSLLLAQVTTPPPRLLDLKLALPRTTELQSLLDAFLHKNPDARPASAQAGIELVDGMLRLLDDPTASSQGLAFMGALSNSQGPRVSESQGTVQSLSSSPAKWRWIAGAVAAAFALGAFLAWPRPDKPSAPPLPTLVVHSSVTPAPALPGGPGLHTVQLVSKPVGASVELSGVEIGKTPYNVQFRQATRLRVTMPGYTARDVVVDAKSEPIVVVELAPAPVSRKGRREVAEPATGQAPPAPAPVAVAPAPIPAVSAAPTPAVAPAPAAAPAPRMAPAPVALPPPAWLQRPMTPQQRREDMLRRGPLYRDVASAKRAYRERRIGEDAYEDTIWVLKTIRANRINNEKLNYKRGLITRDELERRIDRIDLDYEGR